MSGKKVLLLTMTGALTMCVVFHASQDEWLSAGTVVFRIEPEVLS